MPEISDGSFAEEFDRSVSDQIARCQRAIETSRAIRAYWIVAAAMDRARAHRDKRVAHNEAWRPSVSEIVDWDDIEQLLVLAKEFASLVGPAYAGVDVATLSAGAKMLRTSTQRMVTRATDGLGAAS